MWILSLTGLPPEDALGLIRSSPLAAETVPAAFYCFIKFEPEEGLITAAASGGDTDSVASIAGSLFGAAAGTPWIPERWLSALEQKGRIEDAARGLFHLSAEFCR